jgi:hypothetical protein
MDIIREATPTARNDYNCDACEWLVNNGCDWTDYTYAERRLIVKARRNKWRIQKGDKYYLQVNNYYGDFGQFRAIPEMNDICIKYELYQQD